MARRKPGFPRKKRPYVRIMVSNFFLFVNAIFFVLKVNLVFLQADLKNLPGLSKTGARGEVHINLMPSPGPKVCLLSYFVPSGRLCENIRAFQGQVYFAK